MTVEALTGVCIRSVLTVSVLLTGSGSSISPSSCLVAGFWSADDVDDVVEGGRYAAEKTSLGVSHGSEQFRRAFRHSGLERLGRLVHRLTHHFSVHRV